MGSKFGHNVTLETRQKIREKLTGTKLSIEHKTKISKSLKGKYVGETNPMFGRKLTEEHKLKISCASKEMFKNPVIKEKHKKSMSGHIGCKHTEETKNKLSQYKGELSSNWKGGISQSPYCEKWTHEFRERVRSFFGRVCVNCGLSEELNKQLLCVHHINYDKMSCCNDTRPLFVSLCVSCHMKSNHNRDKWEKQYTKIINDKYKGKCYFPPPTRTTNPCSFAILPTHWIISSSFDLKQLATESTKALVSELLSRCAENSPSLSMR